MFTSLPLTFTKHLLGKLFLERKETEEECQAKTRFDTIGRYSVSGVGESKEKPDVKYLAKGVTSVMTRHSLSRFLSQTP